MTQRHYRNLFLACFLVAIVSFAMGLAGRRYVGHRRVGHPLWLASLTGRGMSRAPSQTFAAVLDNLEDSYVDKIQDSDEKKLTYGALRQMMDELDDTNSRFLDPVETKDMLDAEDGVFHGIGALVNIQATHTKAGEDRRAVVVNVLPNGPAARAGLKVGDTILMIDSQAVLGPHSRLPIVRRADRSPLPASNTPDSEDTVLFSTHDIMQRLSQDGKSMRLVVAGSDPKTLEAVDVQTAETRIPSVQTIAQPDGVAEIRIVGFTKDVARELDAALRDATDAGSRRLVLDLRGCVGGRLDRAVSLAARFTDGPIGSVDRKGASGTAKTPLVAERAPGAWSGPVVVMLDRSTIGSAEFLAATLAARGRATLVGTPTFGDGMEHSVVLLNDGSSLLMTTGKIFTSDGRSYQAKGVTPNVAVASAAEQMSAALKAFRPAAGGQ